MLTFPPGVFRPHRNLECSFQQSIAFNHFHCIRYTMYHPFCYKCVCNMLSTFVFFHCILYTMNSDCKEYKRIFFPLLLFTVIMTTLTHSMYTVYNQTYHMLFVRLSLLVILRAASTRIVRLRVYHNCVILRFSSCPACRCCTCSVVACLFHCSCNTHNLHRDTTLFTVT